MPTKSKKKHSCGCKKCKTAAAKKKRMKRKLALSRGRTDKDGCHVGHCHEKGETKKTTSRAKAAASRGRKKKTMSAELRKLIDSRPVQPFEGDMFHVTKESNVSSIKDKGLEPSPGTFGEGVYFSAKGNTSAATGLFNEPAAIAKVRFKSKNRLSLDLTKGTKISEWRKQIDYQIWEQLKPMKPGGRQRLIDAGYDSVGVKFGDNDWTIALKKEAFELKTIDSVAAKKKLRPMTRRTKKSVNND